MITTRSNSFSKLFRPILEAKKARASFGGFLSVSSLILAVGIYPLAKYTPVSALEPASFPMVELSTSETGPASLIPELTGISQGYKSEHPGIDITARLGSLIYPIKPGRIAKISISKFNYGRSLVVDHGNGLISLYAHMGKIFVNEGDEVEPTTQLGEVGVTGRTSGPHLHLEIRRKGVAQNPLAYLR